MRTILIVGAGKSSSSLIKYLMSNAYRMKCNLVVADGSLEAIKDKINKNKSVKAVAIDITSAIERQQLVKDADLVISLLPPHLHIFLAKDCLLFKKNLITSSYISPEIKEMDAAVKKAGLTFMCEMGLDPGIDHMSASQIIHSIQRVASTITSFKSYCGGLIAPESDTNPWHYKISWNPKNIVNAGLGGATYLYHGKEVFVGYEQLFENNKKLHFNNLGNLAYYPNRDSLKYLETYEIPDAQNFMRATLRHPDFCKGWDAIIKLGLTSSDDDNQQCYTYADWLKYKTGYNASVPIQKHVSNLLHLGGADDKIIKMLQWLGLFDDTPIASTSKVSCDILLELLVSKWKLEPHDKDMVVMRHDVVYTHKGQNIHLTSTMIVKGENAKYSAMAKTVGLPMGILAKLMMQNRIDLPKGVHIPNMPAVYRPILNELKHHDIFFEESVS